MTRRIHFRIWRSKIITFCTTTFLIVLMSGCSTKESTIDDYNKGYSFEAQEIKHITIQGECSKIADRVATIGGTNIDATHPDQKFRILARSMNIGDYHIASDIVIWVNDCTPIESREVHGFLNEGLRSKGGAIILTALAYATSTTKSQAKKKKYMKMAKEDLSYMMNHLMYTAPEYTHFSKLERVLMRQEWWYEYSDYIAAETKQAGAARELIFKKYHEDRPMRNYWLSFFQIHPPLHFDM